MSIVTKKNKVSGKLFKKIGTEPQKQQHSSQNERSASFRTSASFRASFSAGRSLLSPRSLRNKSKLEEPQLATSNSHLMMNIPRLVRDCVEFIQENDRDKTEGLFRIPGDSDK